MSQFQQPLTYPPQQPETHSGSALCRREILGSYHAVELYQDGALWINDQEEPAIEIKLDAQATQRLRNFLTQPDGQHYPYSQPLNLCFASIRFRHCQIILPLFEHEWKSLKTALRHYSLPKVPIAT